MNDGDKMKKDPHELGEAAKRIGRIAEKDISLRCTQASLTVNKSDEDDEGWDLFVQFPSPTHPTAFLDLAPPQRSCLLQVKATANAGGTVRMTLSNALKLAKYPGPAFLVIAHVPQSRVETLWLVHCDRSYVERVKRATTVNEDQKQEPLNHIFLTFSPDQAPPLHDPPALREALATRIGADTYEYVQQKRRWIDEVGYSDARKTLHVHLDAPPTKERYAELADFAVGLRKSLSLETIDVVDVRFGIERHERTIKNAALEVPNIPTGPAVTVSLVNDDGTDLSFQCKTYVASAVFPFLPQEHDVMRFASSHLEFVVRSDPETRMMRMQWSLRGIEDGVLPRQISDLGNAAKALNWMRLGTAQVTIDSGDTHYQVPIGNYLGSRVPDMERLLQTIENFAHVMRAFDLPLDESAPIFAGELADQDSGINALALIATQRPADVLMAFLLSDMPTELKLGDQCAVMMACGVRLKEVVVVAVTATIGTLVLSAKTPERCELRGTRLPRLASRVFRGGTKVELEQLYDEAEASLKSLGISRIFRNE